MASSTFLGLPLTPTFFIQPDRTLPDLFADLSMQVISIPLLMKVRRQLPRTRDTLFYNILVANRLISLIDTLMILFINNAGTKALIYFSLVRSLLRHLTLIFALGYISVRRFNLISRVDSTSDKPSFPYIILALSFTLIGMFSGITFAYFANGVAMKMAGDAYLVTSPTATRSEFKQVLAGAASPISSMLWQIMQAILLPLVQAIHAGCDGFFYMTVCDIWAKSRMDINRYNYILTRPWFIFTWPYLMSMTVSGMYILLTLCSRTIFTGMSLGFTVELGQFCVTCNWFVFFYSTLPVISKDLAPLPPCAKSTFSGMSHLLWGSGRMSGECEQRHKDRWTPPVDNRWTPPVQQWTPPENDRVSSPYPFSEQDDSSPPVLPESPTDESDLNSALQEVLAIWGPRRPSDVRESTPNFPTLTKSYAQPRRAQSYIPSLDRPLPIPGASVSDSVYDLSSHYTENFNYASVYSDFQRDSTADGSYPGTQSVIYPGTLSVLYPGIQSVQSPDHQSVLYSANQSMVFPDNHVAMSYPENSLPHPRSQ